VEHVQERAFHAWFSALDCSNDGTKAMNPVGKALQSAIMAPKPLRKPFQAA
jgi:hypothetical protein